MKLKLTPRHFDSNTRGISSPIPYVVRLSSSIPDWSFTFPGVDFEEQRFGINDSDDCWEWSGIEDFGFQMVLFIDLKQLPQTHIDFLNGKNVANMSYFNSQGQISISRRFLAILAGVKDNGGDSALFWGLTKEYGIIPRAMLDFVPTGADNAIRTAFVADFYNPNAINDQMIALGKQFLQYFSMDDEFVGNDGITPLPQNLMDALYQSPLQIGIPIPQDPESNWNKQFVDFDGSNIPAHEVVLYKVDFVNHPNYPYFIYDQYTPNLKQLSKDYLLYRVTNGVVTPVLQPEQTIPTQAIPYPSEKNVFVKIWEAIAEVFPFLQN